jgi:hypothetical protein
MGVLVETDQSSTWIPPPKKKWIRHYLLSKCGIFILLKSINNYKHRCMFGNYTTNDNGRVYFVI